MSKVNYRRLKEKKWKTHIRLPLKPNKVIDPLSTYDRTNEKEDIKKGLEEYYEDSKT